MFIFISHPAHEVNDIQVDMTTSVHACVTDCDCNIITHSHRHNQLIASPAHTYPNENSNFSQIRYCIFLNKVSIISKYFTKHVSLIIFYKNVYRTALVRTTLDSAQNQIIYQLSAIILPSTIDSENLIKIRPYSRTF